MSLWNSLKFLSLKSQVLRIILWYLKIDFHNEIIRTSSPKKFRKFVSNLLSFFWAVFCDKKDIMFLRPDGIFWISYTRHNTRRIYLLLILYNCKMKPFSHELPPKLFLHMFRFERKTSNHQKLFILEIFPFTHLRIFFILQQNVKLKLEKFWLEQHIFQVFCTLTLFTSYQHPNRVNR